MINTIGSIFLIGMGLIFSVFYKKIGVSAARFQSKFFRINFDARYYKYPYLIIGIIFVIVGILSLVGVLHF